MKSDKGRRSRKARRVLGKGHFQFGLLFWAVKGLRKVIFRLKSCSHNVYSLNIFRVAKQLRNTTATLCITLFYQTRQNAYHILKNSLNLSLIMLIRKKCCFEITRKQYSIISAIILLPSRYTKFKKRCMDVVLTC